MFRVTYGGAGGASVDSGCWLGLSGWYSVFGCVEFKFASVYNQIEKMNAGFLVQWWRFIVNSLLFTALLLHSASPKSGHVKPFKHLSFRQSPETLFCSPSYAKWILLSPKDHGSELHRPSKSYVAVPICSSPREWYRELPWEALGSGFAPVAANAVEALAPLLTGHEEGPGFRV